MAKAKDEQRDDGGNGEEMVEPCRRVKLILGIVLSQRRYRRQRCGAYRLNSTVKDLQDGLITMGLIVTYPT